MFRPLRALPSDGGFEERAALEAVVPFLSIHSHDEEPQSGEQLAEEGGEEDRGDELFGEGGEEQKGEAVDEVADAGDGLEDAEGAGKISGAEEEVAEEEAGDAEEDEADAEAVLVEVEGEGGEIGALVRGEGV